MFTVDVKQQNNNKINLDANISKVDYIIVAEGTKFVALYDYTAQLKGELSLEKGDILLGKEKDRNGWMHGVKETNGQEGWFPAVYVDEVIYRIAGNWTIYK